MLLGIFVLVLIAGTMINYRLQADQPVAQVAQQPVTQVAQQPKRILIPTWTSIPTLTPVPTQTPIPTQTSTPTQVPTLTVTPLPEPVLIEYDDLARHTESNVGRHVLMRGKVIQVIEHGDEFYTLLVDVTYDGYIWDDTVMAHCFCTFRPLEGDIVGFSAIVEGRYTYETVLGASVTVPNLTVVILTLLD